MKVYESNPTVPVVRPRYEMAPRLPTRESGGVAGPDKVSLSEEVQRVRQQRADRIAALKARVAEGTYKVDLDRLSERVVDKELP